MQPQLERPLSAVTPLRRTRLTAAIVAYVGLLLLTVLPLGTNAFDQTTQTTAETVSLLETTFGGEMATDTHHHVTRSVDGSYGHSERKKIRELIPEDYSIHDPPPLINGKPVPVKFSVSIKNIPDINELKQMLSVEMNLRIYWQDMRLLNVSKILLEKSKDVLNRSYVSLNPVVLSDIWVPDIYTDYAKSVSTHRILSPPTSLRIYKNATLRYSSRIMMEMSCPMEFKMYPADTQQCELRLESYGFTREELTFSWVEEGRVVNMDHRLAHFDFKANLINDRNDVHFMSGSYPAIAICLKFQRRLNYHLLQTYIPSGLFVIVSWVSFLVPRECAPGRLAICMTTLLTLTAMFGAVRQNTPSVSYIKALDIWMVGCIVFVFFALAEFASVLRLDKQLKVTERKTNNKKPSSEGKEEENKCKKSSWGCVAPRQIGSGHFRFTESPDKNESRLKRKWISGGETFEITTESEDNNQKHRKKYKVTDESLTTLRRNMELISAIIAPIGFIIFNLWYWPWILLTPSRDVEC